MTTYPLNTLVLNIDQGSPYVLMLDFDDLEGYDASVWRLRFAQPGASTSFYESAEGDWESVSAVSRILTIDAATTAAFPVGNFVYQLDILSDDPAYPSFRPRINITNGQVNGGLPATE